MNKRSNAIHVIGIDASGFYGLTLKQIELLRSAKNIAAPNRVLKSFSSWWNNNKFGKEKPIILSSDKPIELIDILRKEDGETVLLASGDPLWFGIGRLLSVHLPKERLHFYPAATSLQLAFSRLGRSWQDATWISIHGRDPYELANRLRQNPKALVVLTDPKRGGAKEVQKVLKDVELEDSYEFWIFEELGHPEEKVQKIVPNQKISSDLNPFHLVVLLRAKPKRNNPLPFFGIEDGSFMQYEDRPGLMTKREIRVQILADLDLPEEGVIWDICAGVGSIGLEALRLRPKLKLVAIDRRIGCKELIKANAQILNVEPTTIFEAEVLETLSGNQLSKNLLNPDRMILGGGGSKKLIILEELLKNLKPGGIIVIPLSTIESISEVEKIMKSFDLLVSIKSHQAYRGVSLGEGTRLAPMNPVFIVKGTYK